MIEIDLTKEDIEKGTPASKTHCPFGIAIKRCTGEHHVFVYSDYCVVGDHTYDFLPALRVKISDYDLDGKIEPFKFSLEKRT